MNVSKLCAECDERDCIHCSLGNPCIGCSDYDEAHDLCKSNGACGDPDNMWKANKQWQRKEKGGRVY